MKGDFTRSTFNAKKHYSSVRMQQGRVQLDADWNELVDIDKHRNETGTRDIIGPSGVPIDDKGIGDGFKVECAVSDLRIHSGRIYVDGILCDNPDDILLTQQIDLPDYPSNKPPGKYLAYLDVWQRHMTAIEDPEIREVALGGPDTATRTKTVWQVKLLNLGAQLTGLNCISVLQINDWTDMLKESGMMCAYTKPEQISKKPCIISPTSEYRRLENQLYRVEIHTKGGHGKATFKWSRDNGSMVFAIKKFFDKEPKKIQLESLGRDKNPALAPGQWVEILDDSTELWGKPGTIALIEDVDVAGCIITLNTSITGNDLNGKPMVHPRVRRWDMTSVLDENKKPIKDLKDGIPVAAGEIELEDGIYVSFDFDGKEYRTGDYWLIPARTESALNKSGSIQWQQDDSHKPEKLRPEGIRHHYCSLALLEKTAGSWNLLGDCRPQFPAVTDLTGLFYLGGDGQEAMPGNNLPEPLKVGVSNGRWPVVGAKVEFRIIEGTDGKLRKTEPGLDSNLPQIIETDQDGLATCYWKLGDIQDKNNPVPPPQKVQASLLDANEDPVHLPIYFNANLSIAGDVAYQPASNCIELAGENKNLTTVRAELNIPSNTYSTVADILDALLCKFNADDLPLEKSDDLCKALKDDTSIKTVQDALNKLCQIHEGGCTHTVAPGTGWENVFDRISAGQDAKICFKTGTYVVDRPIIIKNKGHLMISGCGSGTRIIISKGETIFQFESCKSVTIKDLYGESGKVGFEKEKKLNYLNGTLTFCSCPNITVQSVEIKCAAGPERAASCINVRDAVEYAEESALVKQVESVHIHNCDLHIGLMQVGILLINVHRAHVEDNVLNVSQMPKDMSLSKLLLNKRFRSAIRSLMIPAPHLGQPENNDVFLGGDVVGIKAGKGFVWFKTDPSLVKAWDKWFRLDKPRGVQNDRDLLFHLFRIADRVLLNNGILTVNESQFDGFKNWYEMLNKVNVDAGSQGIVIGGSIATDINILNNRIQGVMQGIHIGISHRGVIPSTHDTAQVVRIMNNNINVLLPSYGTRERHGIFVGNCNSLIIQDNYTSVQRTPITESLNIDGIRVHGFAGKMIIIRQNHILKYTYGIHFWPVNNVSGTTQWIITDNMAQDSKKDAVILLPEEWNEEWSEEKKTKLQEKNSQLRKIIRGLNYNFK